MKPNEVPIPLRMRHLDLDHRGFPIFYIAQRDPSNGRAMFAVNDFIKQRECAERDLCEICGTKLFRGRWFIGGPLSAFHPQGAYNDAPMHDECAHYSLNVCPWLSAPNYARAVGVQQAAKLPFGTFVEDPTQTELQARPTLFVAVMCVAQSNRMGYAGMYTFQPKRPYRKVEFWIHGRQLSLDDGALMAREYMQQALVRQNENVS